uniref:serine/threonine protein kinase n=1 Tax=Archangium sp. TaxID=1872627 RepID=UPI00286A263C
TMRLPARRLPVPDDVVGQYRVVAQVGRGGQGHVYQAECAGRLIVLKLFQSRLESPWGELEIDILRRIEHPNVVRIRGYGRWPDPEEGFLYIAMEYVEGLALEEHVLEHNPSARQGATLVSKAARALGVVHRRGIQHRDIKPDNLLVREADGEPVWVDFGVGHLEGHTTLPGLRGLPAGTPEFTSPEAYRFLQENFDKEVRYRPGVTDEVWALGVTLYWLLTDELPFGTRDTNPHMVKHIRTRTPPAPHEDNPRVPVALSAVCMRMLEKQPEARYPDMEAVAAALEAALALAEGDAGWDVPLLDPDAPDSRTTEEIPGQVVERDTWERVEQKLKAARPRRGRTHKARREPPPPPPPEGPPAVVAPLEAQGPANGVEEVAEALPPPAAAVEEASAPARRVPRVRTGAVVVLLVLLGAMALVGRWALQGRPPGWLASHPTPHALSSGEVATARKPSEAGEGAAPVGASTPAPQLSTAMPRKTDARTKPEEKPAPRPRREAPGCVPLTTETCVAGLCTLLLTGCTSTPQVVRPPPRAADCPPGAVRTMKEELGIHVGDKFLVTFPRPEGGVQPVTVREDTEVWNLGPIGTLRTGAKLYGRLHLGAELIHGRFTELRTPDGRTYPVCMALSRRSEGPIGVAREDVGGPANSAVVISTNMVTAVDRFE